MSDFLIILTEYSEKHGKNVFSIRGMGKQYDNMYRWLNGDKCSARSVRTDFPWDHIVFDDPFDEQSFLTIYDAEYQRGGNGIIFTKDTTSPYRPLRPQRHKAGVVPHEDRVPGQSYMENCGHYHRWDPTPEGWSLDQEVSDALSTEMAKAIDDEILKELFALSQKQPTIEL
jgi:hypothetical protein